MPHKFTTLPRNFQTKKEVFSPLPKTASSLFRAAIPRRLHHASTALSVTDPRQAALKLLEHRIGFSFTLDDETIESIIEVSKNLK